MISTPSEDPVFFEGKPGKSHAPMLYAITAWKEGHWVLAEYIFL